jgi:hypothetical protein
MYSWNMLGLNTLETIGVDYGRGDAFQALPFELRAGPKICSGEMGGEGSKILFLYPAHLKPLYDRFKAANPKGLVFGRSDSSFNEYAPPGLSKKDIDALQEERKIFVDLFNTDAHLGCPHAKKYLPELFESGIVDKMAADPWLNVRLLGKAIREGRVPDGPGESPRWSPEWRAYCDRLIASGAHK